MLPRLDLSFLVPRLLSHREWGWDFVFIWPRLLSHREWGWDFVFKWPRLLSHREWGWAGASHLPPLASCFRPRVSAFRETDHLWWMVGGCRHFRNQSIEVPPRPPSTDRFSEVGADVILQCDISLAACTPRCMANTGEISPDGLQYEIRNLEDPVEPDPV